MTVHDTGYSVIGDVFHKTEMDVVLERLSAGSLQRTKAGARHLLNVPVVQDLSGDSRMLWIARQFVGAGAVPFRATLFDKSPDANWLVVWHQDTALPLQQRLEDPAWGPWSTKAGILYLARAGVGARTGNCASGQSRQLVGDQRPVANSPAHPSRRGL